jgi:hypothetical protein
MKHDWKDEEKVWRKVTGWEKRKESRTRQKNAKRAC